MTMVNSKESYSETYKKTKKDKMSRLIHSFTLLEIRIDDLNAL